MGVLTLLRQAPALIVLGIGMLLGGALGGLAGGGLTALRYEGVSVPVPFWGPLRVFDGIVPAAREGATAAERGRCRAAELEAQVAELARQRDAAARVLDEQRLRAMAARAAAADRQERIDALSREAEARPDACRAGDADVRGLRDAWGASRRRKGAD